MGYTALGQYFVEYPADMAARTGVQHFGRVAPDWKAFTDAIIAEKAACGPGEEIKVFFFSRHGHSRHNAIPEPMLPHWEGLLVEERSTNVVDAPLTPIGEDQTKTLAAKISKALSEGMPAPTKVLTSIAWRTCQTAVEVWSQANPKEGIHAIQDLRDQLLGMPFTKLGPPSKKVVAFPTVTIPSGLPEEDEFFEEMGGLEGQVVYDKRGIKVFEEIWEKSAGNDYVAVVAHQDPLQAFWTKVFGLEGPNFGAAEMRIIVIKRTADSTN